MNKNTRNIKVSIRSVTSKRRHSSSNTSRGFASSESYVKAVTRIYNQEINDIGRFVRFAELHATPKK